MAFEMIDEQSVTVMWRTFPDSLGMIKMLSFLGPIQRTVKGLDQGMLSREETDSVLTGYSDLDGQPMDSNR